MATRDHPQCPEMRYEALASDPETELRRTCNLIDAAYDPAMLKPSVLDASPAGAARFIWNKNAADAPVPTRKRPLAARHRSDERRAFAHAVGALLIALGYARDDSWIEE